MILTKKKLIGLLNKDYLEGEKTLQVRYAGQTLFTATLSQNVLIRNMMEKERYRFEESLDMPSYEDFMVTFWASNVLKWKNQEQILAKILEEANRHPFNAERKLYLSFDTCALRHRSNAVIRQFLNQNKLYIGVVMATGVKEELKGWDTKYKDVEELKKKVFGAQRFLGQPNLNARKTKIGYIEYRDIKNSTYATETETEPGDHNIIKALNKYKKEKDIDLMIISEDTGFQETAQDEKMVAPLVQQQKNMPTKLECTWEEFTDWIYTTAIIFGVIKIGKHHIYGIWAGKTRENWYEQEIDVE